MDTKVEELEMTLWATQQKVEELTAEMANQRNVEDQKHLDNAKEAEEFSQRIVQLEQEKAEVNAELEKKLAKIVEMHTEVQEKSEELAEKAKQIDALLIQMNESTSQLSLETWFDCLAFVPRHHLGKIVPEIGGRKFASIIQKFLHEYGEFMIDEIEIVAPYQEDPSPRPRVRARQLRFEMAETQMPANIKSFHFFILSYFDESVITFMQKFQQNGLLDNVNLSFCRVLSKDILQQVLCHLLPLVNGINSIYVRDSAQLVDFFNAGKSKEIYELNMKMMEETRFLGVSYYYHYDPEILGANKSELYCRWLYQTASADGKPRMLVLYYLMDGAYSPIYLFIDRLKQDFLMVTNPVTFFIRINLSEHFQLQEDICLDNDKTNERLLIKTKVVNVPDFDDDNLKEVVLLISRSPLASTKKWILANEKEILNWDFRTTALTIPLPRAFKLCIVF